MEEHRHPHGDCAHGHHDHAHDHAHEHDHDHGHDHDHDHAHHHDHEAGGVHISRHEGALIGSVQGHLPCGDFQRAQEALTEQMHAIGRRICGEGGIIGHIKFIVSAPEHCCQISLTDTTENARYFDADSCRVEGVAIVFNIGEETLRTILQETLGAALE